MQQSKLSQITKNAIELPIKFTQSLMEKTEQVKTPSPKVDKIGRSIGAYAGVLLLLAGGTGLMIGRSSWAIGSLSVGAITILSNMICFGKNKK